VTFNLTRDAGAIAARATSNSQKKTRTASSLIPLIQNHPKNLSLIQLPSMSETSESGGSENADEIAQSTSSKSSTDRKHTYSGSSNAIAADRVTTKLAAPPAPTSNLGADIETIQQQLPENILHAKQASNDSLKHLRHGADERNTQDGRNQPKLKKQALLD